MLKQNRRGFTLVELAAVVGVGSLIAAQVMPMAKRARSNSRGTGSASNLMQIGQGAGMFGVDNADLIPAYTVAPENGAPFNYDIGGGETYRVRDAVGGAAAQQAEILRRRTGRYDGEHRVGADNTRVWNRRYTNLLIMDYMNSPFPDTLFIDPADANQLGWAANPLDYASGSGVPYSEYDSSLDGLPLGYDDDSNWTRMNVRNRWAFASSYQTTVTAWAPDGTDGNGSYHPVAETPHLFGSNYLGGTFSDFRFGRQFGEVSFPSGRVYQFEEFDREQAGDPYFGYDHARPEKLMFDGSVNSWASGDARPSWNQDVGKQEWRQTYVPLDQFPLPLAGLGDDTRISQRYRWTLGGLSGVDYPQQLSGRNGLGR